jgi:hypothetical protein
VIIPVYNLLFKEDGLPYKAPKERSMVELTGIEPVAS